ncbi:MAG: hypothetical protein ILP16_10005 [Spirochaetales bacterium]|nr:hypothetical protein [Spirochaetales bacterium]
MEQFAFTPANGFKDANAFADPATEEATRSQLFLPHEQTRDYINNTVVPVVTNLENMVQAIAGMAGDPEALQDILDAIASIQDFLAVAEDIAYVE